MMPNLGGGGGDIGWQGFFFFGWQGELGVGVLKDVLLYHVPCDWGRLIQSECLPLLNHQKLTCELPVNMRNL